MNITPKHFCFDNIDVKKLVYTNTLVFWYIDKMSEILFYKKGGQIWLNF
jgi:hypothetical protein